VNASSTFNSEKTFTSFADRVVLEIIVPNLVWKAGRYVRTYGCAVDLRAGIDTALGVENI
jgi:hypothetical protein